MNRSIVDPQELSPIMERFHSFAILVFLGTSFLTSTANAQVWTQRTPGSSPGMRFDYAMAYDQARQRTVLFGGWDGGSMHYGDTWEWDGTQWTQLFPATSPSARHGADMDYDAARQVIVLYGGFDGAVDQGDTWEWNGVDWALRSTGGPGGRRGQELNYHAGRGKVVLQGGVQFAATLLGDMWEWDGSSWIQITTDPRNQANHGMVYDAAHDVLVTMGGDTGASSVLGTSEVWNGSWSAVGAPLPSPRAEPAMAYDPVREVAVLFGGYTFSGSVDSFTWEFDGTSWSSMALTPSPPLQHGQMVYDSTRNILTAYFSSGETWEYGSATGGNSKWNATTHSVGSSPRDVVLVDLDGGTGLDVVTANRGSDDLTFLPNDGMGGFAGTPSTIAVGGSNQGVIALAAADLDDDGSADELAVACDTSHTVALIDDPLGTPVVTSIAVNGFVPVHVATGDLDAADATDDVVVACEGDLLLGGGGVEVILNGGAPTLLPPAAPVSQVIQVATGDLDGDGDQDIVAVGRGSSDQVLLYANDGTGTFTLAGTLSLGTVGLANGLCVDDLDGDTDLDLAVVLPALFPTPTQELLIFRYTGGGTLDASDYTAIATPIVSTGTFATDVTCGDFEDDGLADVIVCDPGGNLAESFHGFDGGSETFAETDAPTHGTNPVAAAIADLDGDGNVDLVICNQGSDDVTINLTIVPALVQIYGTGCPGTSALIPQISASGPPIVGTSPFSVDVSNARAIAPALLLLGVDADEVLLGGGCSLLVAPPTISVLRFTNLTGQASVALGLPSVGVGTDVYFQWVVFDPNGAFSNVLALSEGLRLQLGN